MGKPKLRSSIKALHQALFNCRLPETKTATWVCIQQAKTDSFRDACTSFPSMYYSASSSSDLCSINEELEQSSTEQTNGESNSTTSSSSASAIDSDNSHRVKGFISSKRFFFSPCTSKSLFATIVEDSSPSELVVEGFISSKRFFFYPCTTNSIMEEEESDTPSETTADMGYQEIEFSESPLLERELKEGEGRQCMAMEKGFCDDSVKMPMASMNPFVDFRASMEEMVVAHGLKEWHCLQELLQCYLRLNDKKLHKIIILAFADLLVNLLTDETNETNTNSSSSSSSSNNNKDISCLSFPLCLQLLEGEKKGQENRGKIAHLHV